jgi:hypothetical protein
MDYSTSEIISRLATQVAEQLRQRLDSGPTGDRPARLDQIETELRDMLRALGAEALSQYLSTPAEAPPRQVPCPCGGKVTYQREREAVVISLFGRVRYRRAYYAGCDCGQGQAPRDVQVGLRPGAVSPGLANLLALGGIELAFEQSVTWLEAFLGFRVSENTIRQATEALGAYQAGQDTLCAQQGQAEDFLQIQLRQGPAAPDRLYGSIDAAKVRMEPRTQAADGEKWRDVKVGCWYQTQAVSPAQRSARQREKATREQRVCRAHQQRYYCAIDEADTFGQLLWRAKWCSCAMARLGSGIWLSTITRRRSRLSIGTMPKTISNGWPTPPGPTSTRGPTGLNP